MARPMKMFMRGKNVAQLQEILRRMGYDIRDRQGLFGVDTRDAVKAYQKQYGLKPTAVVDEALMRQMQGGVATPPAGSSEAEAEPSMLPENQSDLEALVRLLIQKGVLTREEWDKERKKVVPGCLMS